MHRSRMWKPVPKPPVIRWDRPKDRLSQARFDEDVLHILDALVEVRHLFAEAVDGGSWSSRTDVGGSRHTGFEDNDPTYSAATRPTQKQLRGSARHAATLVVEARDRLEMAVDALHRGMLRTDPEVLSQFLEKRQAATQK